MTPEIKLVWWVFLVLALLVTLADVYLLGRVIKLSRHIHELTGTTLTAAGGIVRNTGAAPALTQTVKLIEALASKTAALDPLTAQVVRRLGR